MFCNVGFVIIVGLEFRGNVIVNTYPGVPETVKYAACTVPVTIGSVTPPTTVRVGVEEGLNATVPGVVVTARFPKFMSVTLSIPIGVTIVAVTVAFLVICAYVLLDKIINMNAIVNT